MPEYLVNLFCYIVGPLFVIGCVAFVLTVILEGP